MNTKIFRSRFFILIILAVIISNITIPAVNRINKSEAVTKNKKFSGTYFDYYTEKEIREELKKAGVNNKSIETFIITNNNVKKDELDFDELEKGFLKALKYDKKNYLASDAIGQLYYDDITDDENSHLKALRYSEQTVKINPKFQRGYEHLAWVSRSSKNKMEAEKSKNIAEKVIELSPESPVGYFVLSEYYEYYKKDYDKSIPLAKKAKDLAYNGKEPKRYYYETALAADVYGMVLLDEAAPGERVEDFGEYSHSNKDIGDTLLYSLFDTYMKKGNDVETFNYFFSSYKDMKEYREFLAKRKVTYDRLDKIVKEIKDLNEKYKNKNRKLYEENLRKFKELGF